MAPSIQRGPGASSDTISSKLQSEEALFVNALDLADKYLELHGQLTAALKVAAFELVQARYTLGPNSVGQAQYPASMTASKLVTVSFDAEACVKYTLAPAGALPRTSLAGAEVEPQYSGPSPANQKAAQAANITHQSIANGDERNGDCPPGREFGDLIHEFAHKFECSSSGGLAGGAEAVRPSRPDQPLQWFGALPSRHIRTAQANFQEVVDQVVSIATVRTALQTACDRFDAHSSAEKTLTEQQ